QSGEIEDLRKQADALYAARDYSGALARYRLAASETEQQETKDSGKPGTATAEVLGSLAWCALHAGEFAEALAATDQALGLAPDLLWIETNRAHALLLLGRLEDARSAYLRHKGHRVPPARKRFWEDIIQEDFEALGSAARDRAAFADILSVLFADASQPQQDVQRLRARAEELYAAGKYAE